MSFLHPGIITGPYFSRRLGLSLGLNLLSTQQKVCNYDCVYCECGCMDSSPVKDLQLPNSNQVLASLRSAIASLKEKNMIPDSITFSGNGEPTLHPLFAAIIQEVVAFRDSNPDLVKTKICVISNATLIHKEDIQYALGFADKILLKLDAGNESLLKAINRPLDKNFSFDRLVDRLKNFPLPFYLQSMFLKGTLNGVDLDNSRGENFAQWLQAVKEIHPPMVMLYGLDREAPYKQLQKLSKEDLENLARQVRDKGIEAKAYF